MHRDRDKKKKVESEKKKASGKGFSKAKKLLASPMVTVGMFGLAAALLLGSAPVWACLLYTSDAADDV